MALSWNPHSIVHGWGPTRSDRRGNKFRFRQVYMRKLSNLPLLASAIAAALAGQGIAFAGDVSGKVTESESGRPLPNATVRIAELNLLTQSDRAGQYRFTNVPAG